MPAAEARRQALIALGVGEPVHEAYRDQQGLPRLESLLQDVRRLLFLRGSAIFSIGVTAGLVGCAFAGPLLAHLIYGVSPRDPLALATGPLVLALVAMLAIWLPALRAMRLDPIAALRSE